MLEKDSEHDAVCMTTRNGEWDAAGGTRVTEHTGFGERGTRVG